MTLITHLLTLPPSMHSPSRISPDEFLALSDSNSCTDQDRLASLTSSSFYLGKEDSFDCTFEHLPRAEKPSSERVAEFTLSNSSLNNSMTLVRRAEGVYSKYDLNWASIEDYLDNWDILSKEDQISLRLLVLGDMHTNANRFGVKNKNLESHLLLSLGCDMKNILNTAKDPVRSNLKTPKGDYSAMCIDNRAVDAKTCFRAAGKFNKTYSVEKLFNLGLVAYQAVIVSDSSYRSVDDMDTKKKYHKFYRDNANYISNLCMKQKKIMSYFYSHELSVDSILGGEYRPHTHVIFFLPREEFKGADQSRVEMLEAKFNRSFEDRTLSILRTEVDGEGRFKIARKYSEIEKSIGYLHRAYSLADQYLREIRETNVRELNKATVECYHNLVWLLKTSVGESKGVRRVGCGYIPKVKELSDYKHPLLQKAKKDTKIKKSKALAKSSKPSSPDVKSTLNAKTRSRQPCKGHAGHAASDEEQTSHEASDDSSAVNVCLSKHSVSREALGGSERHSRRSSKLRTSSRRVHGRGRQAHVSGPSPQGSSCSTFAQAGNDKRTSCMGRILRGTQKARSKRRLYRWHDERSR